MIAVVWMRLRVRKTVPFHGCATSTKLSLSNFVARQCHKFSIKYARYDTQDSFVRSFVRSFVSFYFYPRRNKASCIPARHRCSEWKFRVGVPYCTLAYIHKQTGLRKRIEMHERRDTYIDNILRNAGVEIINVDVSPVF